MTLIDIILVSLVAAALALAVRSVLRDHKKGGCSGGRTGCSECSGRCYSDCRGPESSEKHSQ